MISRSNINELLKVRRSKLNVNEKNLVERVMFSLIVASLMYSFPGT